MWHTLSLQQNTEETIAVYIAVCILVTVIVAGLIQRHLPALEVVLRGFYSLIGGTMLYYTAAVLFGAPLLDEMQRTILFSALMATLAVVPMGCFIGFDVYTWRRLLIEFRFEGFADRLYEFWCTTVLICTSLGAWLGAIPIPLDWDRPWQVWPVSCVYGGLAGCALGHIIAAIGWHFPLHEKSNRDHDD